jgi:light-regulated signal transduction histidine kinase (bacteriophytochrome)
VKLEDANQEMEAFIYSVSHDLKNPLRTTSGFLRILLKKYDHQLDEEGRNLMARIEKSAVKMNNIIDNLLRLSQIARQEIDSKRVNLTKMAETIIAELRFAQPRKQATVLIREGLSAVVDRRFIEIALTNLLGNAWKYTEKKNETLIEFGMLAGTEGDGQEVFFIKDNGAGFDVQRADKMFKPFQRLHAASEFEGTGIGLAIVERVIRRLGGRIWAEGVPEQGAVFYFTLAGVENRDR